MSKQSKSNRKYILNGIKKRKKQKWRMFDVSLGVD